MFDQMFEGLRKANEAAAEMQQEMARKWAAMVTGVPGTPAAWGEQAQKFQKKWADTAVELYKRQAEAFDAQFKAGMKHLEEAFRTAEVKDLESLRANVVELWKKSFDYYRQVCEAQMREFQAAAAKWAEVMTKGAA